MPYNLLSDLTQEKKNWEIKVRIVRIWESTNPASNNEVMSLDCMLLDEKVCIFHTFL
jgi:hypothetical protein